MHFLRGRRSSASVSVWTTTNPVTGNCATAFYEVAAAFVAAAVPVEFGFADA